MRLAQKERSGTMNYTKQVLDGVIDFFSEIMILGRTPRLGWRETGPLMEDIVAGHVGRTSIIAFVLARLNGLNQSQAYRTVTAAVFHDNPETRLDDREAVSISYLPTPPETIEEVVQDQVDSLPRPVKDEIAELTIEVNCRDSPMAEIVRDADVLEVALCTKIVDERKDTDNIPDLEQRFTLYHQRLNTELAKKLLERILERENLCVYLAGDFYNRTNNKN